MKNRSMPPSVIIPEIPYPDYPYGERQYADEDHGGHRWTFSQTVRDVDPDEWGGVLFE
jgi:hypothetical protein